MGKPEFLAINPQHTIPTIVDGDFRIWESRAITTYLANQYGKDDSYYPKDPKIRAKVDHLLYFDIGTLFGRFSNIVYPVMRGEVKEITPVKLESIYEAIGWLEGFLEGQKWAVGNHITVADFSLITSIQTLELSKANVKKYKNICRWKENCQKEMKDYDEVCSEALQVVGKIITAKFPHINLWKD